MRATFVMTGVLVLAGCRGWESDKPPVHLIHNMDTQEKGRAYRRDTSGLFQDGRVMRPPVEGTVALGQLDEDDVYFEGVDGAQPTLKYPAAIKADDALKARGKLRYEIYCAPCHGVLGDGKGLMTLPAIDGTKRLEVPPPSFHDTRLKQLPVGKIYSAIKNGVNANNMPSYATQIPVADRWAIVAYVRKLQIDGDASVAEEGGVNLAPVAKASKASLEHGEALFKAKTCVACHSLDGSRLVGPSFKGAFGRTEKTNLGDVVVDEAYLKESMLTPQAKIVEGFPPAMPPMQLDDIEVQSLILFIKAQK
jgi:mono/diheme cytochrome c family protein